MRNNLTANRDTKVFYVGKKRPKVENTFGTKLRFMPGQAHILMSTIADNLLGFPEVFAAEGSTELAAFIANNPLDAAKQGLVKLDDKTTATLQAAADAEAAALAEKKAQELDDDEGMLIPANGGDEAVNEAEAAEHLAAMKAEIDNLLTKQAIQDWVNEKGIDVTLSGNKADFVAQAYEHYCLSLNTGS